MTMIRKPAGNPNHSVRGLDEVAGDEVPPLEHVMIARALGTPYVPDVLEQFTRFAKEVMPVFTSTAGA